MCRTIVRPALRRGDDELGWLMSDFNQSNPELIRHKGLRERVEYFKSSEEGVSQMCEILEQMREETAAWAMEKGIEKGDERRLVDDVRSLMETLGLTAQKALASLRVPEHDWPRYLAML